MACGAGIAGLPQLSLHAIHWKRGESELGGPGPGVSAYGSFLK